MPTQIQNCGLRPDVTRISRYKFIIKIPTSHYIVIRKNMRIPLKFRKYSICNDRFKCFRFHVCHFYFQLNSHRIVHRAMLLSAAITSKTNAATLSLLPKVIYAIWFTKFITFSPKNHPRHLYFPWRNSITDWTISKIATSFDHTFDGSRNTPEWNGKFRPSTKIFQLGGAAFAHPPLFEG